MLFSHLQIADGVKPTLAELEKFEQQPESIDIDRILYNIYHNQSCML